MKKLFLFLVRFFRLFFRKKEKQVPVLLKKAKPEQMPVLKCKKVKKGKGKYFLFLENDNVIDVISRQAKKQMLCHLQS